MIEGIMNLFQTDLEEALRPPKNGSTMNTPSIIRKVNQKEIDTIRDCLGVTVQDAGHESHDLSGWMNISGHVEEHTDQEGLDLVYCGHGCGILWKENKPVHLSTGFYTTFNDRYPHSFTTISRSCKILVVSISRGVRFKNEFYVS